MKNPKNHYRSGFRIGQIREALAGGEWKSLDEIVAFLDPHIPPEAAIRVSATSRKYKSVPLGKRRLVKKRLDMLARNGARIERKEENGGYFYRLKSGDAK